MIIAIMIMPNILPHLGPELPVRVTDLSQRLALLQSGSLRCRIPTRARPMPPARRRNNQHPPTWLTPSADFVTLSAVVAMQYRDCIRLTRRRAIGVSLT